MTEGAGSVLETAKTVIAPKVWTTFRVVISTTNTVTVYNRIGEGSNILLFKHKFESMGKGKVGLATSANDQAYFDDFKVDPYDPANENPPGKYESPDYYSCVTDIDADSINKRCTAHFGGFPVYLAKKYVEECANKYNFCDMCCDKVINKHQ